jgi:hypothetical protein
MKHEWYDAAGGLGLELAASSDPAAEPHFAGLIRTKSPNQYEIERWDGATDARPTLAEAQTRLLAMVGAHA